MTPDVPKEEIGVPGQTPAKGLTTSSPRASSDQRAGTRVYIALALVTAATISLELTWMRLFSISIWHHFAYMVIAIAMVGFGAAGAFPYFVRRIETVPTARILGVSARLFAVLSIVSLLILSQVTADFIDLLRGRERIIVMMRSILVCYGLQFATFFCGGLYIMTTISRYPLQVNGLYSADLLGAAGGCILVIGCLQFLTGPQVVLVIACLVALAAVIAVPKSRLGVVSSAGIVIAALLIGFIFPIRIQVSPSKHLRYLNPQNYEEIIEMSRWNSLGRIDVTRESTDYLPPPYSGILKEKHLPFASYKLFYYDGTAMSPIFHTDGDVSKLEFIPYTLHYLPHLLLDRPRVLVIGVGGGIDILTAKYCDAEFIKGIELNPITVNLITKDYADYTGRVFLTDEVSIEAAEGRNYVSRAEGEEFDLVQLTSVDTLTGLSSGAYAFSENFLYTAEAFGQYMSRLSEDGVLSIARVRFVPARETLRLVTTAMLAHERGSGPDPKTNLVVIDAAREKMNLWGAFLLKKQPFTREEVARLRAVADRAGFVFVYDPFNHYDNEFWRFLNAGDRAKFLRDYWFNVDPTTDNKPYFFQFLKWRNLFGWNPRSHGFQVPIQLSVILALAIQALVLVAIFIVFPLYRYQREIVASVKGSLLGYFTCLGIGFMLIEIVAMQKFTLYLGSPIWAITAVLFTLLLFSGIGSYVGRAMTPRSSFIAVLLLAIAAWTVGFAVFSETVFRQTLGFGLALRTMITFLLLGPLGFLMGIPFPTGIRLLSERAPRLIPIAWGTNACSSTLGSILSMMLSVTYGYLLVLLIGAAIYILAWVFVRGMINPRAAPGTA